MGALEAVGDFIWDHRSITGMVISFALAMALTGIAARRLKENGFVAEDKHKRNKPLVPLMGGVVILTTALIGFGVLMLIFPVESLTYEILFVLVLFGYFGLMDDLFKFPRRLNLIGPLILSIPVMGLFENTEINFPFLPTIDFGLFFFVIVALYILTVSNLVNLYAGFNGLSMGTAAIVLFSLLFKAWIYGETEFIAFPACILGALLGFVYYNMYPSRIFEGNVGSFLVGGTIGVVIVFQGYWVSGFIMLLPHTYNFLMEVVNLARRVPVKGRQYAKLRPDGTLMVPGPTELKFIFPYHFRMTEKQATLVLFLLTGVCCVIGIILPPYW